MNEAPPYMLFYIDDFLAGIAFLRNQSVGQYVCLLCAQWKHGKLPSDLEQLEDLARLRRGETLTDEVLAKFPATEDGGHRMNPRLAKERDLAISRIARGRKGGEGRSPGGGEANPEAKPQAKGRAKPQANPEAKPQASQNSELRTQNSEKKREAASASSPPDSAAAPMVWVDEFHEELAGVGCAIRRADDYVRLRDGNAQDWTEANRREWICEAANQTDGIKNGFTWLRSRIEMSARKRTGGGNGFKKLTRDDSNDFRD